MIRRHRGLVLALLLAGFLAGCSENQDAQEPGASSAPRSDTAIAEGTGYMLRPPTGFRDVTSRFKESRSNIDLAYVEKVESGFAANLLVVIEQPGTGVDVDAAIDELIRQAEGERADAGISEVEDRELGGVPAKTFSYLAGQNEEGQVRQRMVVAVEGESLYGLAWSVLEDEFEEHEAVFDEVLASWRWT